MNSKKMMLIGIIVLIIALGFGFILFFLLPGERKETVIPANPPNMIKPESPANKPAHPSSSSKKAKEAGTQIVAIRETVEGDAIQGGGGMTGSAPPAGRMIAMAKSVTGGKSREMDGAPGRTGDTADAERRTINIADAEKAGTDAGTGRTVTGVPVLPAASKKAEGSGNSGKVIFVFNISPYEILENGKLIYNRDKLPLPDKTGIQNDGKKFILTRPEGSYSYTFTLQNHREIQQNVKIGNGKTESFNLRFGK